MIDSTHKLNCFTTRLFIRHSLVDERKLIYLLITEEEKYIYIYINIFFHKTRFDWLNKINSRTKKIISQTRRKKMSYYSTYENYADHRQETKVSYYSTFENYADHRVNYLQIFEAILMLQTNVQNLFHVHHKLYLKNPEEHLHDFEDFLESSE